jgi:lipoprotein-releasing system permease protein
MWLIGWLATGSVALGVASLIITLAVMSGFRDDIRQKILGIQPHVILTPFDGRLKLDSSKTEDILNSDKNIVAWAPFVSGQVLIGRGSQSSGAMLKGIDPTREPAVAQLQNKLIRGNWTDLMSSGGTDKPKIFLGAELARNLGARMGDTIWIITPGSIGISAFSVPRAHLFIVQGLIQSGLYDYDSTLAYADLAETQKLFGLENSVSGIGIRIHNADQSEEFVRVLQQELDGSYWVRSWLSLNKNLFSALKLEKTVMFIILILVTLVASVMIVSNLLLNITQKTKEIGILRAIGANEKIIREIFLIQGVLMGLIGTFLGAIIGVGISVILAHTNFIHLPADVYYIDRLPIQIDPRDVAFVVFVACLIVLLATLVPANRATKVDPLEAIRYG